MTICPTCETTGFANPGELAAHLIDEHAMSGLRALELARKTFPQEETSMAKNPDRTGECPECHCLRHQRSCSQYIGHNRKKTGPMPAASAKKRKPITRRHPLPSRKAGGPKGAATNGLVSEIAALGAVAEALTALDLDQRRNVLGCICKLLQIDPTKLGAL